MTIEVCVFVEICDFTTIGILCMLAMSQRAVLIAVIITARVIVRNASRESFAYNHFSTEIIMLVKYSKLTFAWPRASSFSS